MGHRSQGGSDRSVHLHMWERKSRNWRQMKQESKEGQPLWCPCAAGQGRRWKALRTLREPLSSRSRYRLPPEEQRLRDAETTHSCLFMFIWMCEQSCLGCLRQRKWISGGQLIFLDYFWARWNRKMNLCPPHCLKGMCLFILHFNAPLAIYSVSLNELLIEWRCITWEINKKGYQASKRKRKEKTERWYFN